MSDHRLPDDPADWPDDPHLLLGVGEQADLPTLRRAYNRLIRRYRPDEFPAEFQQIRQAYETACSFAQWRDQFPDDDDSEDDGAETAAAGNADSPHNDEEDLSSNFPSSAVQPDPSAVGFQEEIDEAWNRAKEGDIRSAYRSLIQLHERRPELDEVVLRLYWLLKIKPSIDSDKQPADWLVEGMCRSSASGRLMQLYWSELENRPAEAVSPRIYRLLEASSEPFQRNDLLSRRWNAAASRDLPRIVEADLERERRRMQIDQSEEWARLLFTATDYLAWRQDDPTAQSLFNRCCTELEEFDHLHIPLEMEFQRFDHLRELQKTCESVWDTNVPSEWLELVRDSWNGPDEQLRRRVHALLVTWVRAPGRALGILDRLNHDSAVAVRQLETLFLRVGRSYYDYDTGDDSDLLTRSIEQWLQANAGQNYKKLRVLAMQFCLEEMISADMFVNIALNNRWSRIAFSDAAAETLNIDAPLHCVIAGCNAIRS